MKKTFKFYAICWAILLAVFNVVCFVTPDQAGKYVKFGESFWVGYVFITLAFLGHLLCAFFTFKPQNINKMFYRLPLISINYTGVVLTLIFGAICMAVSNLPNWVGIVLCMLILAFNGIAVLKAAASAEIVASIDEKVKEKTQFVKLATVDAQNIMNRATSNTAKAECKKVYEALRYSDPMSSHTLFAEEQKITAKMEELATAVTTDADTIPEIAEEILLLVQERNNKCKALKQ